MKTQRLKYIMASFLLIALSSCYDQERGDKSVDLDNIIEDGFYISGQALPFEDINVKGRLVEAIEESSNNYRDGFYDIYMRLEKGKSFRFIEVLGRNRTGYGPVGDYKVNQADVSDEYTGQVLKGEVSVNNASFTVDETGVYHIAFDRTTNTFAAVPVTNWTIIGDASEGGWEDKQAQGTSKGNIMMPVSDSNLKVVYRLEGTVISEGEFKFRHSCAWKQSLNDEAKMNTNFSCTASDLSNGKIHISNLVAGGDNATLTKASRGVYTATATWEAGRGWEFDLSYTNSADLPDYPSTLLIRGDGANGWFTGDGIPMTVHSGKKNSFYSIVYLKGEGTSIKFADTDENWDNNWGIATTAKPDDIDGGIEYTLSGGENIPVPDEEGYYMVNVDFELNKVAFVKPLVYLTGDLTGTWGVRDESNLFIIDGDEFVSPAFTKSAALRIFTVTPYNSEWWQCEMNIIDGSIVMRTDDELPAVNATSGQRAFINFRTGEASIK